VAVAASGDSSLQLRAGSGPLTAAPGSSVSRTVTAVALGTQPVTVLSIALEAESSTFRVSGRYPPFTLTPGQFEALTVVFAPPAEGAYWTTATFHTTAGDVSLRLDGTGATQDALTAMGGLVGTAGAQGAKAGGQAVALPSDEVILGTMSKDVIDAVIKRNMNQVRYCYQRELTKDPTLAGKIVVKFVIAKDGTVTSAVTKSSTMASPAVEECVNGRFMHMQFPEPSGGGIVIVSYPFSFSPGA
jgi:hypothetical protein